LGNHFSSPPNLDLALGFKKFERSHSQHPWAGPRFLYRRAALRIPFEVRHSKFDSILIHHPHQASTEHLMPQ